MTVFETFPGNGGQSVEHDRRCASLGACKGVSENYCNCYLHRSSTANPQLPNLLAIVCREGVAAAALDASIASGKAAWASTSSAEVLCAPAPATASISPRYLHAAPLAPCCTPSFSPSFPLPLAPAHSPQLGLQNKGWGSNAGAGGTTI
ncbi:hypothetical protein HDV64DRAFT_268490 [Trichoderma sp. TUCIM 5745]